MKKSIILLLGIWMSAIPSLFAQIDGQLGQAQPMLPRDGHEIKQSGVRPVFLWSPVPGAMQYHFIAVEVYHGQRPIDALRNNHPIIDVWTYGTSLSWPAEVFIPAQNRTIVWAVQAFAGEIPAGDPFTWSEYATLNFVFSPTLTFQYPWNQTIQNFISRTDLATEQDCKDISELIKQLVDRMNTLMSEKALAEQNLTQKNQELAVVQGQILQNQQDIADCERAQNDIKDRREEIAQEIADEIGATVEPWDPNGPLPAEGHAVVNQLGSIDFGGAAVNMTESQIDEFSEALNKRRKEMKELRELEEECRDNTQQLKDAIDQLRIEEKQLTDRIAQIEADIRKIEEELVDLMQALMLLSAMEDICEFNVAMLEEGREKLEGVKDKWTQATGGTAVDGGAGSGKDFAKADSLIAEAGGKLGDLEFDDANTLIGKADSLISAGADKKLGEDCLEKVKKALDALSQKVINKKNANPALDLSEVVDQLNGMKADVQAAEKAIEQGNYEPAKALCDKYPVESDGTPIGGSPIANLHEQLDAIVCANGDTRTRRILYHKDYLLGFVRVPHQLDPKKVLGDLEELINSEFPEVPGTYPVPRTGGNEARDILDRHPIVADITCTITEECQNGKWVEIAVEECYFEIKISVGGRRRQLFRNHTGKHISEVIAQDVQSIVDRAQAF
ncbi:hypothetical protein [Pontibacter sp. G13]|uniref:coiled-coil domain-containing protein n=1 Tax=Pontibacter sp. G13 TaxID=3074898 RepID=UPI00288AA3BE|nr:hypothetical protein [Pontibacter sp. G13]WNJ16090.1 hypothetical protein RJD25_14600 [Pontibacter sp. G13]